MMESTYEAFHKIYKFNLIILFLYICLIIFNLLILYNSAKRQKNHIFVLELKNLDYWQAITFIVHCGNANLLSGIIN